MVTNKVHVAFNQENFPKYSFNPTWCMEKCIAVTLFDRR